MKRRLWSVLIVGAIVGCSVTGPLIYTAEDSYSLTLASAGVTSLQVHWRTGKVTFRVDDTATQIAVTGKKTAVASSQSDADLAIADIDVTLAAAEGDATTGVLTMSMPIGSTILRSATAEIVVPAGLALTISCDNGEVNVTGNSGSTTVTTENGAVTVKEQTGNTSVTVSNGAIEIESTGGNVTADSDNGAISVKASPDAGGTVSARTDLGAVVILVPSTFAASLNLEANLGTVQASLDSFTVNNLSAGPRKITATLNGGGGQIDGETSLGNVTFGPRT